ncbi:MAG: glycosyltransferase family 9 protein [Leptotrichiaceae bacterium]|nr:glycosyltransferase family 9 protein [Leptotrichiaceae bacterium]
MELEFNKIKKLLFLRYDGKIGDYIITSWIYREIKKQRPDIEIDIVGISKNEKLFLNNKNVNRFYKLKKSKKPFMYFLAKKLRAENYDVIIDPTEHLRKRDIFFIKNIKAKVVFGYDKEEINIFDKNIGNNSKRMKEVYAEILEQLGFSNLNMDYEIPLDKEAEEKVDKYLEKKKIDNYIVVNFFGAAKNKKINNENAIKLIDVLHMKYKDKKIIILDSPSDRKALDNILKNVLDNERVYFYPNSTIFEAIEIIKKSILVVSPDTAIIHIADGFDKKIISFYKNEKITYDKWKISEDNEIHFYENNINELDFSNINL